MKLIIGLYKRGCLGLFMVLCIIAGWSSMTNAAVFEVPDADVDTLVAALNSANDEDLFPGDDTIILPQGGSFELMDAIGSSQNGLPVVTSTIRIQGNGSTVARAPASAIFRFFAIEETGHLLLDQLVLSGGYADDGGAVFNRGYLEMNGGGLHGNQALYRGGAIFNPDNAWASLRGVELRNNVSELSSGGAMHLHSGNVEILDSTLIDNRAVSASGGALFAVMHSHAFIDGCTFANNQSVSGGAIFNYFGSEMIINNSTLSGNLADSYGGAISNVYIGAMSLTGTTLVDNNAEILGASIYVEDDSRIDLAASLVASRNEVVSHCYGETISADDSSVVSDNSCEGAFFAPYAALKLGPLVNNGGPTMTHALYTGSLAIDHVDATGDSVDQRGVARPQDGDGDTIAKTDAGAFEHEVSLAIDIEPNDALNMVKLNSSQVDVLVLHGYTGLDLTSLTAEDMVGAEIVFGDERAPMTKDLAHPKHFLHHMTEDGLMLHFSIEETGLDVSDKMACLAMYFSDGRSFRGCDVVDVVY